MELYEKNGNAIYILNILRKYTDENHILKCDEIKEKVNEIYEVDIDPRTIRRNINLLKYKLGYDISTRQENGVGYYIYKDPDTEFEQGEIRAIIDTFSYANYIVPSISKSIISKCKNMQNVYENEKLKDYQIYANNTKTENMEVLKNIEDISDAIYNKSKISFEYWKYAINEKLEKEIVGKIQATPFAIVYNLQEFYVICLKDGADKLYNYRLDRIKNVVKVKCNTMPKISDEKISEFVKSNVDMFAGKTEYIEAKCNMCLLDDVIERFGKDIEIKKLNNNAFKMKVCVNKDGFKFWALRNLENVQVISPASFKNEIVNIIKENIKKYGN